MNLVAKSLVRSEGVIIETSIDKRQGIIATGLVQHGKLQVGNFFVAGASWGKVRRLLSDQELDIKDAGPSTPVQVRILYSFVHKLVFFSLR